MRKTVPFIAIGPKTAASSPTGMTRIEVRQLITSKNTQHRALAT
jgi:hypothetical protein